ncbi:MAG: sensor histidine kinase, partial [Pyrinomonadaceae bacterium]
MKNSRLLTAVIIGLFGLLILLGGLQYIWLGEISDSERENLQNRLDGDTRNFARDFNSEMRRAYFTFQIDPGDWLKKDWTQFIQKYSLWKSEAAYSNLIEDLYFVGKDSAPIRYDPAAQTFKPAQWTDELREVRAKIRENEKYNAVDAIVINDYTLLMPNYASGKEVSVNEKGVSILKADLSGYVVIKLDEKVVSQFLDDLIQKYFPDNGFARYNISVTNNPDSKLIYSNNENSPLDWEKSDANIALLDLSSANFKMLVNSNLFSQNKNSNSPNNLANPPLPKMDKDDTVKIQMTDSEKDKPKEIPAKGIWTLSVRHIDGSLEQFISNTRHRNLAISFGILTLLGASILLIFLAAQRAKLLAQRQIDFVSAVSHEFRTPLAVIYSAGENLSDGVIQRKEKVADYGNLIKSEGKKLSAMVERILEFAGARSGRRKYDLRAANVGEVIEHALAQCRSLLDEKNFVVEKEIGANLPKVIADKTAFSRAIENLIANAVKYSGGNNYLKIAAQNGGGKIKIIVEDKG